MAKTLNAIISGASFVPSFMGGNYATQTSSFGKIGAITFKQKNYSARNPAYGYGID